MSVNVNTYAYKNIVYGTKSYFSTLPVNGDMSSLDFGSITLESFEYAGYVNCIAPYLITLPEWEALTKQDTDFNGNYSRIEGDINGFDATEWHTKLKIFATDGSTYAMGYYVWRHNYSNHVNYNLTICGWRTSKPYWSAAQYISYAVRDGGLIANSYLKQPYYIYLGICTDSNNKTLGIKYYFDETGKLICLTDGLFGDYSGGHNFITALQNVSSAPDPQPEPAIDADPYFPGGTTNTGGGTGDFDNTSDAVGFPSLPSLSAADTGFITLYNPTIPQLKNLCNYMWSDLFDLATFRKLFADPMDAILGLSLVPVAVPNSGTKEISVGNIPTGISMSVASTQFVEVDCGSLNVNEHWGSYLDYDPFTKAEIYLPYIGTRPISVDDIMGKTVSVVYHVDILSGACCAYIKCGGSVLYSYIGQCASSIPISGNDWTSVINGVLSIAGSIGSMVASGGATAPMAIENIASTAVNSFKTSVEKSGAMSGAGGMLAIQRPYLILTRPRQALPSFQYKYTGYPSFITTNLSDLSGYTEIDSIHLENIDATENELNEIESLLKGGVIF